MSEIAGDSLTTVEKIHKPSCKRNASGELDVFEATQYFSDFNEPSPIQQSRIQTPKQNVVVAEHRQNRVHPETEKQLREPTVVVIVKRQEEKEMMRRRGGGKLTRFLNSLLRSAGLKKSKLKSKSTPEVEETPRGERRRRNSCVATTHAAGASPISDVDVWRLSARRRSFDVKNVKGEQKLSIKFCESYNKNGDNVNGGCEFDSSSESDLFELDLFAN